MTIETLTDTHCHIIDKEALRYPWLADAPALDRNWTIADYSAEARKVGIARVLHMEVDVAPEQIAAETEHIEQLAAEPDSLLTGIIASCRPEMERFCDEIEAALDRPLVKGFRRALHVVPDEVSQTEVFRANMRRLAGVSLPFDICVMARQLPLAIALADAAPETCFVLDHCGVPDIAGGGWDEWAQNISSLAQRENVCAKVSGLPAYARQDWTATELGQWVDHLADAFGTHRLVWGGDWPVCTLGGGLSSWVAATRAIFGGYSPDERAAVYNDNATRIWGL